MRRLILAAVVLWLGLAGSVAWADGVDVQAAKASGLDPEKLAALRTRLLEFVEKKQMSGAVAVIGRRGRTVALEVVGQSDLKNQLPMSSDTLFRIASMTKPITAIGIMMLEEEGKLSVDDPVEKHLPEFSRQRIVQSRNGEILTIGPAPRPITLRDLLTHTSGMSGLPSGLSELYKLRNHTLAAAVLAYSQQPLEFPPGSKWSYCNTGIDTLGRVIEVVSGESFESFLEKRLFAPLGMKDTFFYPTAPMAQRIARIYKPEGDELVESDNFLGQAVGGKYPLPAGGLFSTAGDQARLYRMMLEGGLWEGRRILSEASIKKMTQVHTGQMPAGFTPGIGMGFGWQVVREPTGVTASLSPGSYGHGGAYGTQGWLDPSRQMFFILMVQRSGFGNGDASEIRQALQEVGVDAIVD